MELDFGKFLGQRLVSFRRFRRHHSLPVPVAKMKQSKSFFVVDGMSIFIFMNFVVCCVVKQLNSLRYVWKGSEYLTCHQLIRI